MAQNTLTVRVDAVQREAIDITSFRLVDRDGGHLPAFASGSHIDVHLPAGLVRQYSLCGDPGDTTHYDIAVKQEPNSRGGSIAMSRLTPGDELVISHPRNNFMLAPSASLHLLLAGGIGITPLLSMIRHLRHGKEAFQLHYFARSEEHAAFRDVLAEPDIRRSVCFHLGVQPPDMQAHLRDILGERTSGAHLYMCGPGPFMDAVRAAATDWPHDTVHLEYFAGDAKVLAAPRHVFEIVLAQSGGTYGVPEDKTIVQVLAEHGIEVEVSCEQGVCGTCLTTVLEGVPDHRDMYLTDDEKQAGSCMTICVSRAISKRLVLDR